ncbi:MAG: diacylglycerol kinase family lipid kinase [Acidobacteria bacterium]|nr:diacylglycerol kinase family lipid kinase [Acidobacteriota bacterium]
MNNYSRTGSAAGPIAVIVNPRAANNRTARAWAGLRAQLEARLGPLSVFETAAPEHATELTQAALRQGCKTVIAVGGDGTISEVANGFFHEDGPLAPDAVLGIIPQGTASDFQRALRIPARREAAVEIIRQGHAQRIDLARVRFHTREGRRAHRYGVNITSFGMGGAVAARMNRLSRFLGGKLGFQLATALTSVGFRGSRVTLRLDDQAPRECRITNIAVGNGQYHGGGMWVCPRALLDDGWLDVTVIGYVSPFEMLRDRSALYNGRVYEHAKVEFHRARCLEATAEEETLIEVDGEAVGRLPIEISVVPQALAVFLPAG